MTNLLPDTHNGKGVWQGDFRVGWLDLVMTKYAITVSGGVDTLAVTHLDKMNTFPNWKLCIAYDVPIEILSANDNRILKHEKKKNAKTRIIRLRKKEVLEDLTYQESLTDLLSDVNPVYSDVISNKERYLNFIESELNLPISIVSYGPTAIQKYRR